MPYRYRVQGVTPRASNIVGFVEILARQNHINGTVQRGSGSTGSGLNQVGAMHRRSCVKRQLS